VTVTGHGLKRTSVRAKKAGELKLSVPLGARGLAALSGHGRKLKLRVGFAPRIWPQRLRGVARTALSAEAAVICPAASGQRR